MPARAVPRAQKLEKQRIRQRRYEMRLAQRVAQRRPVPEFPAPADPDAAPAESLSTTRVINQSPQRATCQSVGSVGKKREHDPSGGEDNDIDTSKPTVTFEPKEGRKWTLSVAVPGSIIANAQSRELQAILAGQIARALAVFGVDEIVIFDDGQFQGPKDASINEKDPQGKDVGLRRQGYTGYTDPTYFLAHILSYLECPPYLRKALFLMHPDLQHAGMLPSLDMPHHLKKTQWCQYREGVTRGADDGQPSMEKEILERDRQNSYSSVDTGLNKKVYVKAVIPAKTRVTVKFQDQVSPGQKHGHTLEATAVAPSAPREERGYYWGYSIRPASSLSAVLTECSFDGGYDLTFGTSERGIPLSGLLEKPQLEDEGLPTFKHMMIVFGGVAGLEAAVKADTELQRLQARMPESLFDYWVNLCPGQGSKTIRTEEAVWLGLMGLHNIAWLKGRR